MSSAEQEQQQQNAKFDPAFLDDCRSQLSAFTGLQLSSTVFQRLLNVSPENADILTNCVFKRFLGCREDGGNVGTAAGGAGAAAGQGSSNPMHPLRSRIRQLFGTIARRATQDAERATGTDASTTAAAAATAAAAPAAISKRDLLRAIDHDPVVESLCVDSPNLCRILGNDDFSTSLRAAASTAHDDFVTIEELFEMVQRIGTRDAIESMVDAEEETHIGLEKQMASLLVTPPPTR